MNRKRSGLYPILLFILAALMLVPAGGSALAQAPNEINCIPDHFVFLPFVTQSVVISGNVTYHSQPAAGITLALYDLRRTVQIEQVVQTDAEGNYSFINPGKISRHSNGYAVVYENGKNGNPDDASFLSAWMSFAIPALDNSEIPGGNFDIADVGLASPASEQTVALPAVFGWALRPSESDTYTFNLSAEGETQAIWSGPALGYVADFTLQTLPDGLILGEKYGWSIAVFAPDGGRGVSYWTRSVVFSAEAETNATPDLESD